MNHIIVFHDKSTKEVTQEIADIIMEKSCDPKLQGVKIQDNFYKFSSISKILTLDEYYKQYPDKRSEEVRNTFQTQYANEQIRQPTGKAKELLIKGFSQYHREQGRNQAEIDAKVRSFFGL